MELAIHANLRTLFGKQVRKLRDSGRLPAVLYGRDRKPVSLEVDFKEFEKVYRKSGENAILNLTVAGEGEHKVLIHDIAKHFMKNEPIHVDFYEVDLKRKIRAKVPLHFLGVSLAVKEQGGILVKNLAEVEVEALPADLPQFLEVNIETLKTFSDLIRVSDLKLDNPEVNILTHAEEAVASVQAPRSEEELAELEKPAAEAEKAAIEGMAKEAEAKAETAEEALDGEETKKETKEDAEKKKE